MQKDDIVQNLEDAHQELFNWFDTQEEEKWEIGPDNKWTAGQHALHLLQSIQTLNKALTIPKFLLKYRFGKTNRPVREYEAVVSRYHEKLTETQGAVFGPSRNMRIPNLNDRMDLLDRIQIENKKLQYKTNKWSDKHLDNLVLPHPLMGKMPVREIIMWTAYHVRHHTNTLKTQY